MLINKTIDEIIKEIRIILDTNEDNTPLTGVGDIDQLQMDDIIRSAMRRAYATICKLAPYEMLREMQSYATVTWSTVDAYMQSCELPTDCLRVIYVKLNEWKRGVSDFVNVDDPLYDVLRSEDECVRPSKRFPAAALVPSLTTAGGLTLEAYPKTGDTSGKVTYIQELTLDSSFSEAQPQNQDTQGQDTQGATEPAGDTAGTVAATVKLSVDLYHAFLYLTASLYYLTLKETDMSERFAKEATQSLGFDINTAQS